MRSIDNSFYKSKEWRKCRDAYISQHPLCERCLAKGQINPAEIVHHKIYLSEENYLNPAISLNFENLESVCKQHHNQEHFGLKTDRRWSFNSDGSLTVAEIAADSPQTD